VRSGALFRNGNCRKGRARPTADNGKYLREKGKSLLTNPAKAGFLYFIGRTVSRVKGSDTAPEQAKTTEAQELHIYLIRHGETDWNTKLLFQGHSDTKLNKSGIRQAGYIAREFKGRKIDAIISSDLKRAYDTARIIASACGCAGIKRDKRLRERDYGSLEGRRYELYRDRKSDFDGENDRRFFARVNRAFDDIVRKYQGRDILIVTHGGVVRQIVSHVLGLKDYKKLRIYNSSISEVFYNEKKKAFFLLHLNGVAHLPKAQRNKIEYHIKGV